MSPVWPRRRSEPAVAPLRWSTNRALLGCGSPSVSMLGEVGSGSGGDAAVRLNDRQPAVSSDLALPSVFVEFVVTSRTQRQQKFEVGRVDGGERGRGLSLEPMAVGRRWSRSPIGNTRVAHGSVGRRSRRIQIILRHGELLGGRRSPAPEGSKNRDGLHPKYGLPT